MRPRRAEPSDPELEPFADLSVAHPRRDVVIEGELAVTRALAGGWPVQTVVTAVGRRGSMESRIPADVRWLELDADALRSLTGFDFHRGVLACGARPANRVDPPAPVVAKLSAKDKPTIVLAENLADPSNLGALVRNAAALGADLAIVTSRGADPYSRRAIRASAGHMLDHPLMVTPDPTRTLAVLSDALPSLSAVATTLCSDATPLAQLRCDGPMLVMFGNEGDGLSPSMMALADEHVRIEMAPGVDSLNVAASSAVLLWARRQRLGRGGPW